MSLTYSVSQSHRVLRRVTAVTLIVLLHAAMFIAFNNGLGKLLITRPPTMMHLLPVQPDPPIVKPDPPIESPTIEPQRHLTEPVIEQPDIPVAQDLPTDAITAQPSVTDMPSDVVQSRDHAEIAYRVDPLYPAASQRGGEQGTVLLEVQVNTHGNVINVSVIRSSGFDALDTAAIKAVKQWRFKPSSMVASIRVPIKFELNSQRY